jgi:hypothetical protein
MSFFTLIYEALIGANPFNPEYRGGIFSSVGTVSSVTTIVIGLLFYVALGRWKPVFHKTVHWIITLIFSGIAGFVLAYMLTNSEIGNTDAYALRFAFINMLYAMVCFMVLSLLLKRASIFAKHTPL